MSSAVRFAPRVSLRSNALLLGAFGGLFGFSLVVLVSSFLTGHLDPDELVSGLVFAGFCLVVVLVLLAQAVPLGLVYEVTGEALNLRRLGARRRIERQGITRVETIDAEELSQRFLVLKFTAAAVALRFASVTPVFSQSLGAGLGRPIRRRVVSFGNFVWVTLSDGSPLVLSPVDGNGLCAALGGDA